MTIARSKTAATCCWNAADVSIAASAGFFMLPASMRIRITPDLPATGKRRITQAVMSDFR
jgi:hypothetical protein